MLGSEGPDQQRIRRITEIPFRPRDVEERTQGMIPKLAHELVDGFADRGEVDLFTEYCDPMSVRSLRFMLGLDDVPWQDLLRWNEGMMPGLANFEGDPEKQAPADRASAELGEAIERVMDRLEHEPDGSVLSWMLRHDRDGDRMTREEIVANTKLMLSGGLQEPRDLIALTVWALGSAPGAARTRARGSVAGEGGGRGDAAVGGAGGDVHSPDDAGHGARRRSAGGGSLDRRGPVVGGSRPSRFTDPDRFDIGRKEGAHLAFAIGSHFCLGAWFGRYLARVSLDVLLDRLPNLRLDPDRPVTLSGWEFRAPDSTWVRWDAA